MVDNQRRIRRYRLYVERESDGRSLRFCIIGRVASVIVIIELMLSVYTLGNVTTDPSCTPPFRHASLPPPFSRGHLCRGKTCRNTDLNAERFGTTSLKTKKMLREALHVGSYNPRAIL